MSIHHMTPTKVADFAKDREAKEIESFDTVQEVKVFATSDGIVVGVKRKGDDGYVMIGDSIGVYLGEEAPSYFA